MDLHSSMDRFKGNGVKSFNHSISIYIPVWIDLKVGMVFTMKLWNLNLHSSMDRFEVFARNKTPGWDVWFTFQYG